MLNYLESPLTKGVAFWTSLTSKGCIGRFRSCCHTISNQAASINKLFWKAVLSTDAGGCIVVAEVKSGHLNDLIPWIISCSSKANFACEGDGLVKDYLGPHLPSKVCIYTLF
jgi:hypothetical protein